MLKQLVAGTLRRLAGKDEKRHSGEADVIVLLRDAADRLAEGDSAAAEELCGKVLARDPKQADAINMLGLVALGRRRFSHAEELFEEALALDPQVATYHNNRGIALEELWRPEEALFAFRRALALNPAHELAYGNLLYLLNVLPDVGDDERYREHCRWAEQRAEPLCDPARRYGNDRRADRALRVGYVSADFRNHAVGNFIGPVLERHDPAAVSAFCYSNGEGGDAATEHMRSHSIWRDLSCLSDPRADELIRADGLDVLVDLSGHTRGNRLLVFARKPAPVQITFLGYPATTGMRAIDYRLTDAYADPPGESERYYRERLVRLPHSLWCWQPGPDLPGVAPLPANSAAHVTFGSMNSLLKLNARVIDAWARILAAVPASSLLLATVAPGEARQRIADAFGRNGIDTPRLRFTDRLPTREYRELFGEIDIALDPFPCNGGTTTCESLWMGVPVVTLAGAEFRSRAGRSLLTNAGLPQLVAANQDDYVAIAVALAGDAARLSGLRHELRGALRASPLMDIDGYVRALEAAYRGMWREWCGA